MEKDPKNDSEMLNFEARIKTFKNWPFDADCSCTPEKMAEAGFYCCGGNNEPDLVRCYFCRKELVRIISPAFLHLNLRQLINVMMMMRLTCRMVGSLRTTLGRSTPATLGGNVPISTLARSRQTSQFLTFLEPWSRRNTELSSVTLVSLTGNTPGSVSKTCR